MVSLDEKISIQNSLQASPKASALLAYLNDKKIILPSGDLSQGENNYYILLSSLEHNNSNRIIKVYAELSKRKLVSDQPLVYDNFMLFAVIVGVMKFNLNPDWIRSVVNLRTTINDPEKLITTSFLDLLNGNHLSTDGIPSIVLAALIKNNDQYLNAALLKNSFESNNRITQHLAKDLFLTCIYLFTDNYIVSTSISDEAIQLRHFETIFLNRVRMLQNFIYVLIIAGLIALWFYLIKHYPNVKEFANDLGIVLQVIGIGLFAYLLNLVRNQFGIFIKRFFGYMKKWADSN